MLQYFENLKVAAMPEKKISELAKAAKVDWSSVYTLNNFFQFVFYSNLHRISLPSPNAITNKLTSLLPYFS
jgi:hypothetical protein